MLLLQRRENMGIVIDGHIRVVVKKISGNQVTLGIKAPKNVVVDREEIYWEKLQREDK